MPNNTRYDERDLAIIQQSQRLDSNESIFFARELEHIKSRTYDIQFPELTAIKVIPVSNEVNPGAESITYGQYEPTGYAKIISNYADDLPRADVVGEEFTAKVKSVGTSYGYSIQDVRASRLAGKSLEQRKAASARRSNDQTVNRIAYFGDDKHRLKGLLNHPNIPEYILPADGNESSMKFKDKTPDQILRDLNGMVAQMVATTGGVEIPDTLLLPFDAYADLAARRIGDTNTTVLKFFLEQSPYINNVMPIPELKGAVNDKDVAIIYRKSPEKLTLEIPQGFEQFPPEAKGLEYIIPCHSRCAGVIVYYPLSIMKTVGI